MIALVDERGADDVRLNVETKFDVLHPDETAPRERFVEVLLATLRATSYVDRVSVQSFDWECLDLVHDQEPSIPLNVLTNTAHLEVGAPGSSPWMAGVDVDDFGGDVVAAAAGRGYDALSPQLDLVTPAWVDRAHAADLRVIPYTVDTADQMRRLLDAGVDGLITNRPDVAREVLAERGLPLPPTHPRLDSLNT